MSAPDKLSIVIPVYNEHATLRESIDRLLKVELPLEIEILVVDDGSTDDSVSRIKDLIEEGRLRVVSHKANRGKGAAVRTGIEEATGEILTVFDADLEYDPNDFRELLRPILDGDAEVVYGTRSFGSHTAYSFWYVLGNRFLSLWASFLFNSWLSDIETCFKVAKISAWRSIDIRSKGFGIEAEATAKFLKSGKSIFEIPINYRARSRAEGKKLDWTDGVAALWILLRVRFFG